MYQTIHIFFINISCNLILFLYIYNAIKINIYTKMWYDYSNKTLLKEFEKDIFDKRIVLFELYTDEFVCL